MKNFSNRFLSSSLALVMIVTSVSFTAGCSSSQALADVERFEPVVLNALTLTCTISSASALCTTGEAKVKADYATVIQLWTDYNAAVAAGTASSAKWNDLNAAFSVFEQDASQIFSLGLGVNQPEVTAIVESAQLLLAAIEVAFPSAPKTVSALRPNVFTQQVAAKQAGKKAPQTYDKTWLKNWSKDYNSKVDAAKKKHPKAKLHKIHPHGAFAHYATGGLVD